MPSVSIKFFFLNDPIWPQLGGALNSPWHPAYGLVMRRHFVQRLRSIAAAMLVPLLGVLKS